MHTVARDSVSRRNIVRSYYRSITGRRRGTNEQEDETVADIAIPRRSDRQPDYSQNSDGMRNRATAPTS